jgi:predicted Abi (CAAX) family protease
LLKLDAFTADYDTTAIISSPLLLMLGQLQAMTARYRIGDGTGGTYVGPANNCSQDSNQALFNSLRRIQERIEAIDPDRQQWLQQHPEQATRYHQLVRLRNALEGELQAFGQLRPDWENNEYNLGSTLEDAPLRNLLVGIGSWRTLLPRKASDTIARVFLQNDATAWVLCTNQIGGHDPDIEAIAPMTL